VRVCDAQRGVEILTLPDHTGALLGLALGPAGRSKADAALAPLYS
jgi:hypothetical protein